MSSRNSDAHHLRLPLPARLASPHSPLATYHKLLRPAQDAELFRLPNRYPAARRICMAVAIRMHVRQLPGDRL